MLRGRLGRERGADARVRNCLLGLLGRGPPGGFALERGLDLVSLRGMDGLEGLAADGESSYQAYSHHHSENLL